MKQVTIWDRIFALAIPFRFESGALLEDCGERIQHLDQRPGSLSGKPSITASVMGLGAYGEDVYPFSLAVTYVGRYGIHQNAEIDGVLRDDPEREVTVAEGIARLTSRATWIIGGSIAAIVVSLLGFALPGMEAATFGVMAMALLVSGLTVASGVRDRSELLAKVEHIMSLEGTTERVQKRTWEDLIDNEETTHLVDLATNVPIETNAPVDTENELNESQQKRAQ